MNCEGIAFNVDSQIRARLPGQGNIRDAIIERVGWVRTAIGVKIKNKYIRARNMRISNITIVPSTNCCWWAACNAITVTQSSSILIYDINQNPFSTVLYRALQSTIYHANIHIIFQGHGSEVRNVLWDSYGCIFRIWSSYRLLSNRSYQVQCLRRMENTFCRSLLCNYGKHIDGGLKRIKTIRSSYPHSHTPFIEYSFVTELFCNIFGQVAKFLLLRQNTRRTFQILAYKCRNAQSFSAVAALLAMPRPKRQYTFFK